MQQGIKHKHTLIRQQKKEQRSGGLGVKGEKKTKTCKATKHADTCTVESP